MMTARVLGMAVSEAMLWAPGGMAQAGGPSGEFAASLVLDSNGGRVL